LQLLSEMSVNDIATIGHSLGFSPILDNTKSMKYNGQFTTLNASSGNGFTNNRPYAGVGDNQTEFITLQNTKIRNELTIGLLPSPPRNHPGGSANTLRFGGGYGTVDYESELAELDS
jgi:hypothetical protein